MNNVQINIGPSGLGAPLAGEDFISGYIHYTTALPFGFASYGTIKEIFSIGEAEALGILPTSIGETRATGSLNILLTGATGSILNVNVATNSNIVALGTYTVLSSDTKNTIASNLAASINSANLGYSATATTSTVAVTVPTGTGLGGDAYLFANTTGGSTSITYSSTTFAGGVASEIDILHYQISEYFRLQPQGNLYVMVQSAATNFAEIVTLQNFASGKIRQVGLYSHNTFSTNDVANIQTQIDTCAANFKPLEAIYSPDFSSITDLTTLPDLTTLNGKNVSICIGQDGAAQGEKLWQATAKSIGIIGATLGTISLSNVEESIAWVGKFNISSVEDETLAFAHGAFYNSLSDGLINNIDSKGYIFLRKLVGISGSYFNNPYTCISSTSDFSRINHNRTINKASRGLRIYLLPNLSSRININSDGTITIDVISYFKTIASRALEQMVSNGELSSFSVIINPSQNVLSTNQLIINVQLQPVGVADKITVNLAFALTTTS